MPTGDKSRYTAKQRRQAHHIEEGEKKRGLSSTRAKKIGYATVNKLSGGGKKSGSGRGMGKKGNKAASMSTVHRKAGPKSQSSQQQSRQ